MLRASVCGRREANGRKLNIIFSNKLVSRGLLVLTLNNLFLEKPAKPWPLWEVREKDRVGRRRALEKLLACVEKALKVCDYTRTQLFFRKKKRLIDKQSVSAE